MASISTGMYEAWDYMCAQILRGHIVPINHIALGALSHVVAPEEEPLVCADGDSVRVITLHYSIGDLENEYRH